MKTSLHEIKAYVTKDGSHIQELMHPNLHGCMHMSFAKAAIDPGCSTILHIHLQSEEVYHIAEGKGVMTLGKQTFSVYTGDTVCIRPKIPHKIENNGQGPLVIFCCCAPPYSHKDTEIHTEMG